MKRSDTVFLRRPKRFLKVSLVENYDHFPAARIKIRGKEIIVGRDEVVTETELFTIRRDKMIERYRKEYSSIISRWTDKMDWEQWKLEYGEYWAWNQLKKLFRLGLINHEP